MEGTHHSIILSRVFVCHLSRPCFQFLISKRLARVRLEANHMLLQTDNPGWCKVFIFSTLCSDSTWGKKHFGSCKEGLTRLLRLSFLAHSTKPPNLSKVTFHRQSDMGFSLFFFLPCLLTLRAFPFWLSLWCMM